MATESHEYEVARPDYKEDQEDIELALERPTVSTFLMDLCDARGMTQVNLATTLRVSRPYARLLMRGGELWPHARLVQIAIIFRLSEAQEKRLVWLWHQEQRAAVIKKAAAQQ